MLRGKGGSCCNNFRLASPSKASVSRSLRASRVVIAAALQPVVFTSLRSRLEFFFSLKFGFTEWKKVGKCQDCSFWFDSFLSRFSSQSVLNWHKATSSCCCVILFRWVRDSSLPPPTCWITWSESGVDRCDLHQHGSDGVMTHYTNRQRLVLLLTLGWIATIPVIGNHALFLSHSLLPVSYMASLAHYIVPEWNG